MGGGGGLAESEGGTTPPHGGRRRSTVAFFASAAGRARAIDWGSDPHGFTERPIVTSDGDQPCPRA